MTQDHEPLVIGRHYITGGPVYMPEYQTLTHPLNALIRGKVRHRVIRTGEVQTYNVQRCSVVKTVTTDFLDRHAFFTRPRVACIVNAVVPEDWGNYFSSSR
jgi:hypothetical protein